MVGVAQRQRRGHWDTTPANAWGAVTVRRFAELYPASAITGVTNIGLAGATASQSWPLPAEPVSPLRVALAAATMSLSHQGTGAPWATVSVKAAVPLKAPINAGYRTSSEVHTSELRARMRTRQAVFILKEINNATSFR